MCACGNDVENKVPTSSTIPQIGGVRECGGVNEQGGKFR